MPLVCPPVAALEPPPRPWTPESLSWGVLRPPAPDVVDPLAEGPAPPNCGTGCALSFVLLLANVDPQSPEAVGSNLKFPWGTLGVWARPCPSRPAGLTPSSEESSFLLVTPMEKGTVQLMAAATTGLDMKGVDFLSPSVFVASAMALTCAPVRGG